MDQQRRRHRRYGPGRVHGPVPAQLGRPGQAALPRPRPGHAGLRAGIGTASDIKIEAEQSLHLKRQLAGLIAKQTGQTIEQIERDSDRDRWFTAQEALEYGFIDHVFERASQIKTPDAPNQ